MSVLDTMENYSGPKVDCACGCGEHVKIDGLGSATFESNEGRKLFFCDDKCRLRWTASQPCSGEKHTEPA